jgi:hypothetical protein
VRRARIDLQRGALPVGAVERRSERTASCRRGCWRGYRRTPPSAGRQEWRPSAASAAVLRRSVRLWPRVSCRGGRCSERLRRRPWSGRLWITFFRSSVSRRSDGADTGSGMKGYLSPPGWSPPSPHHALLNSTCCPTPIGGMHQHARATHAQTSKRNAMIPITARAVTASVHVVSMCSLCIAHIPPIPYHPDHRSHALPFISRGL